MENLAPIVGTLDFITKQYADSKGSPVGGVMPFAGTTAPAGWLLCTGQLVSRVTYSALFAVIGTAYGAGDGSTTFAIPSMEAMIGVGSSFIVRSYIIKY